MENRHSASDKENIKKQVKFVFSYGESNSPFFYKFLLDNKDIQCIYYIYGGSIMQAVVQKWGNSLGFRIPSLWAKDNNVKNGSKIEVIAEKGKMVILPQKKTLDDMLAMVTSENIHSEISTGNSVGNEEW